MLMMEEAVEFTFPAVIKIMQNKLAKGGVEISCLHDLTSPANNLIVV